MHQDVSPDNDGAPSSKTAVSYFDTHAEYYEKSH